MILEGFGKGLDENGKEYTYNVMEDGIRDITITDTLIVGIRENGSEVAYRKDDTLYKMYLLNNEGKTLKTLI